MTARMYGPKVSLSDLHARTAERVDNCADSLPFPLPTEPFFIGEHAAKPAPDRSMWQIDRDNPWMLRVYAYSFLGALVLSALCARCSSS